MVVAGEVGQRVEPLHVAGVGEHDVGERLGGLVGVEVEGDDERVLERFGADLGSGDAHQQVRAVVDEHLGAVIEGEVLLVVEGGGREAGGDGPADEVAQVGEIGAAGCRGPAG